MPRLSSAAARLLGLGLSTLLVVAGLLVSSTPATADGARLVDPMAGAPAVGDCYDVSYKQGYEHSIAEKTVDCDRAHTMRVVAVGQLPDSVSWTDTEAVYKAVRKTCDPAWLKITGKEPVTYLTLWSSWWFAPTEAQQDSGARWFSCEVALAAGEKLVDLPRGTLPRAKKKAADSVARCVSRSNTYVACSSPHVYRAAHAFITTAKGSDKAKAKAVAKAAGRTCPRKVARWTGVYSGKPVSQEKNEKKVVVACYKKTTR